MAARPIPGPRKLSPEILVRAYATGVFPMSESQDDPTIFWGSSTRRMDCHAPFGVSQ